MKYLLAASALRAATPNADMAIAIVAASDIEVRVILFIAFISFPANSPTFIDDSV
jgi:hypothetical protein